MDWTQVACLGGLGLLTLAATPCLSWGENALEYKTRYSIEDLNGYTFHPGSSPVVRVDNPSTYSVVPQATQEIVDDSSLGADTINSKDPGITGEPQHPPITSKKSLAANQATQDVKAVVSDERLAQLRQAMKDAALAQVRAAMSKDASAMATARANLEIATKELKDAEITRLRASPAEALKFSPSLTVEKMKRDIYSPEKARESLKTIGNVVLMHKYAKLLQQDRVLAERAMEDALKEIIAQDWRALTHRPVSFLPFSDVVSLKQFIMESKESQELVLARYYQSRPLPESTKRLSDIVQDPAQQKLVVNWTLYTRTRQSLEYFLRDNTLEGRTLREKYGIPDDAFKELFAAELSKVGFKNSDIRELLYTRYQRDLRDQQIERELIRTAKENLIKHVVSSYPLSQQWIDSNQYYVNSAAGAHGSVETFYNAQKEFESNPNKHPINADGCVWVNGTFTKEDQTPLCTPDGNPLVVSTVEK